MKPAFLLFWIQSWPSALRLWVALSAASRNAPVVARCAFFKKHPCHRKNWGELSHAFFAGYSPRNFFQEMGRLDSVLTESRSAPPDMETFTLSGECLINANQRNAVWKSYKFVEAVVLHYATKWRQPPCFCTRTGWNHPNRPLRLELDAAPPRVYISRKTWIYYSYIRCTTFTSL